MKKKVDDAWVAQIRIGEQRSQHLRLAEVRDARFQLAAGSVRVRSGDAPLHAVGRRVHCQDRGDRGRFCQLTRDHGADHARSENDCLHRGPSCASVPRSFGFAIMFRIRRVRDRRGRDELPGPRGEAEVLRGEGADWADIDGVQAVGMIQLVPRRDADLGVVRRFPAQTEVTTELLAPIVQLDAPAPRRSAGRGRGRRARPSRPVIPCTRTRFFSSIRIAISARLRSLRPIREYRAANRSLRCRSFCTQ